MNMDFVARKDLATVVYISHVKYPASIFCQDAENRTRATPTPWAHTTTMLHPEITVRQSVFWRAQPD